MERKLVLIDPDGARYEAEIDLRYRVLREPLGHTRGSVYFPFEDESLHLVALEGESVVGCVLFHPDNPREGRLFQMAVEARLRGQGVGRELVGRLEAELVARGFERVYLHARDHAVAFYERIGYVPFGEPFTEVGVRHLSMERRI